MEESSFADQNGSAAIWIHWRKSGTSKQLLGLLRAVVEDAPCSAVAAGCVRESALHFGLVVISFLFERTQLGALWPAMREWIVDQGGLQTIWQALAWSMALVGVDKAAHDAALREPVHAVIGLMKKTDERHLTLPLSAHPSIVAALTLLFSDLLPRDLASGNAHEWDMHDLLVNVVSVSHQLSSSQPLPQLHRAFIVSWPHLMGWLRQQGSQRSADGQQPCDVKSLTVRHSAENRCYLCRIFSLLIAGLLARIFCCMQPSPYQLPAPIQQSPLLSVPTDILLDVSHPHHSPILGRPAHLLGSALCMRPGCVRNPDSRPAAWANRGGRRNEELGERQGVLSFCAERSLQAHEPDG